MGGQSLPGSEALRRLEAVTDTALAHLSLDALLDELLARVTAILETDTAALLLLDGDVLRPRAAKGLEEALTRNVRVPLGRGFAGRIADESRPIIIEDVSAAEVANPVLREQGIRSLLGVPLLFEGRVIGVLHVGTLRTRRFGTADAQLLQLVADRMALGIAYARLYEDERRARLRAQAVVERSRFLAELGATLASTLDGDTMLRRVVQLAVPDLADGSVLDILREGGRLERIAVAGTDPTEDGLLRTFLHCEPENDARHPVLRALQTGEPQLLPMAPDAPADPADREFAAGVGRLGIRSIMLAPLVVRGQRLGIITFLARRRTFGEMDLQLALEVARRTAFAVENTRLYRAAEDASERLNRQAVRQRKLAEASRAFAEASLDLDTVAAAVVRYVADAIGDVCSLRILSEDGRWLLALGFHHPDPEAQAALAPLVARRQPADGGLAAAILRTGEPLFIPVTDQTELRRLVPAEYHRWLVRFPIRSLLGVPLRVRGRMTGVVLVARVQAGRPYDGDDQLLLQDMADRAALAIENARLYREARDARVAAEDASRAKDEFLATVSHELRTPLAPIIAWSHLLEKGQLDPARTAQAVGAIRRAAKSQAQLVEELLDVSRIVMGKLRLHVRPMDMRPVVESAIEAVRPAAEAKEILLHGVLDHDEMLVSGDPDRLQQVVWNLVSNAVKFTPRRGSVEVSLQCGGSHAQVSVGDTGSGISQEFLPHLFERFRQADSSSTRAHGGLGLGLAIVRHLIELHGGTVAAESAGTGKGALFTIRLPLLAVAKRPLNAGGAMLQDREAPAPPPRLDDVRVLVVDDDPGTCDVVAAILEGAGAGVRASVSASDALAQLDAWRPHVIVADIGMPGEDGYALIRQIRARAAGRGGRTPAVALTAYARPDDRMRALSSGFQMHVAKPVDPDELVAVVASLAIGPGGPAARHES